MARKIISTTGSPVLAKDDENAIPDEPVHIRPAIEATQLPTPPTSAPTTPQKKITQRSHQADPSIGSPATPDEFTATLGLDISTCGSPTRNGQPCKRKTSNEKRARANHRVACIVGLSPGSPALNAGLEDLAEILLCRQHTRNLDLRVRNWIDILSPAGQGSIECLIGAIRKALAFREAKCMRCKWSIGGQKVENCRKTVDKICSLAAEPDGGQEIIYLLRVFKFNRLCLNHDSTKVEETTEWTYAILENFHSYHSGRCQEAECSNSPGLTDGPQTPTRHSTMLSSEETPSPSPSLAGASITTPAEFSGGNPSETLEEEPAGADGDILATCFENMRLESNRVSQVRHPNIRAQSTAEDDPTTSKPSIQSESPEDENNDLRVYWPSAFDKSPLITNRFDPRLIDRLSALREARKVARRAVGAAKRDTGFVYVYQVEDNEGYLKIGWTRSTAELRCAGWELDCNRRTKILYPNDPEPVAVANAWRVEELCHAELGHARLKVDCQGCLKQHQEWFEVGLDVAVGVIRKWSEWMASEPYQQLGASEEGWTLKPGQEDVLAALTV